MKMEEEMRHRVQQKRHQALDRARRQDKLHKMKEDRVIRREIISANKESFGIRYPVLENGKNATLRKSKKPTSSGSSFFMTESKGL